MSEEREILFRGKRIDNGEWVYGLLTYNIADNDGVPHIGYLNGYGSNATEVDRTTVGQDTGLKDTKGQRIFDGDILSTTNANGKLWYVDYKMSSFYVNQANINFCCHLDDFKIREHVEVIGNIHDNPELLEAQHGD